MDRTAADPLIGRVLDGRYRVGPRIARGGMATVYEAVDLRLDRICAVKVMHEGLGDDHDFAARFVREARAAARLSHPHVVNVFDQGDDHGTLFLAMEHIPGHTLRDVIREEAPLAPLQALNLLEPVLSALAAAHAAGLIHRDVKPENVLLAKDGRVKVADFGLARAVSSETQHTATGGVLIGTVSYLSPELVVDGSADARSDVYAAGVLLYEMLTGRKPHQGDSPIQVAYKHVHEDVPPPSELEPDVPTYVDALVARATARDRELRPADAQVFLHQLRRVKAALGEGVQDDPELTADLAPMLPVPHDDDIDYVTEDDVPTILTTAQAAATLGAGDTTVLGAVSRPPERTERTGLMEGPGRPPQPQPQPPGRPRRSRRGPVLLLVVLVLAVGAGLGGWWFGSGRYTTTPGLINMTAAEARDTLAAAGLDYANDDPAYSETVEEGLIMSTDPAGGERVLDNGTVTVTLSLGPERYEVPAVAGMSESEARQAVIDANLALGDVTGRFAENVAEGIVISSSPAPGKELRPGTVVDLVVSKGPKPIKVPDLTGRDAGKAEQRLTRLGFEVSTSEENSDTVDKGDVISQSPDSGTLFKGDTVELVVSEGPVLVEVPNVRAFGVDAATERMEEAGFTVRTEEGRNYLGLGFVSSSDPGFGSMAPRGSLVTLFLV